MKIKDTSNLGYNLKALFKANPDMENKFRSLEIDDCYEMCDNDKQKFVTQALIYAGTNPSDHCSRMYGSQYESIIIDDEFKWLRSRGGILPSFCFYDTNWEIDTVIPNGYSTLSDSCFERSHLKKLILPDTLVQIKNDAFSHAHFEDTSVEIPEGAFLEPYAFYSSNITELKFLGDDYLVDGDDELFWWSMKYLKSVVVKKNGNLHNILKQMAKTNALPEITIKTY